MKWPFSKAQPQEGIITARFVPTEDIHVNELAYIVSKCHHVNGEIGFTQAQWDALTPNVKRHFQ